VSAYHPKFPNWIFRGRSLNRSSIARHGRRPLNPARGPGILQNRQGKVTSNAKCKESFTRSGFYALTFFLRGAVLSRTAQQILMIARKEDVSEHRYADPTEPVAQCGQSEARLEVNEVLLQVFL